MALISCPDCGREMSSEAVACPNCGRPIGKGANKGKDDRQSLGCLILLVVLGLLIANMGRSVPTRVPSAAPVTVGVERWANGGVNIRSGPGTVNPVVRQIAAGQAVRIGPAGADGWAPVLGATGDTAGFVFAELLGRERPTAQVPAAAPSQRSDRAQGPAPVQAALTGCDIDLVTNIPRMVGAAVPRINLWQSADGGQVVGDARGLDASEPTGSPRWCVGELVTILSRTTDARGRRRLLVRTRSGLRGWVTDFFVLDPSR